MDNEKYYTPTIEEFHVGFEYEEFETKELTPRHIKKICQACDMEFINAIFIDKLKSIIRVKFLSAEDIESCGFKEIPKSEFSSYSSIKFILNNGRYYVHLSCLFLSSGCVIEIQTSVEENSARTLVVHSIRIKNKSELLKLMKMLNIK